MADEETEITQTEMKLEQRVTDADLNVLRDQIKHKDAEIALRDRTIEEERKRSQISNSRLGDEIGNRFSAETIAIENAILAATTELESLEKQQANLYEEGKIAEASKLNRQIASAAVKLEKGEDQKRMLESNKQRVQAEVDARKNDPLSVYSPAARNWISSHPQFLNDPAYKAKAMAAHYSAQADGVALDSQEYFNRLTDAVEPKITVNKQSEEDDVDEEKETVKPQQKQVNKSSTAAPVSRQSNANGGGSGNKGGRVQLTPDEAEAAIISRPDLPKEEAYRRYFANKQRAIADGKLGRTA